VTVGGRHTDAPTNETPARRGRRATTVGPMHEQQPTSLAGGSVTYLHCCPLVFYSISSSLPFLFARERFRVKQRSETPRNGSHRIAYCNEAESGPLHSFADCVGNARSFVRCLSSVCLRIDPRGLTERLGKGKRREEPCLALQRVNNRRDEAKSRSRRDDPPSLISTDSTFCLSRIRIRN
jgi:hypothetical protein